MKKFYEKQWLYKTILSVLFVACFFLDFGLLRVKLASPFNTISLWDLPQGTVTATEGEKAFALALVIAFFVSLVPLGLSLISFFKKTPVGFYLVIGYFILYQIAVFVFQGLALALTLNSLALAIAALVLILIALALVIGQKAYGTKDAPEVKQGEAPSTEVPANEAPIATPNGKHASVA